MEPVQTAYRRSARAAGYEPHGAVGPQPEGLHGLSGFFSSQATYEVDTTSRKKRAFITYRTVQREPYRINRLSYDFRDRFLEQIILPDTVHSLLRTGEVFDMEVLTRSGSASPPTSNSAAITILRSITSSMKPTRSAAIIWWT